MGTEASKDVQICRPAPQPKAVKPQPPTLIGRSPLICIYSELSSPIQSSWLVQEWLMEAEAVEEVQIMEELPHSLRREIAFNINRKVFQQLSVFHDFPPQELAAICGMMTPLQVMMPAMHVTSLSWQAARLPGWPSLSRSS